MMWISGDWTEIDAKNLQIEHLQETIDHVRELAKFFEGYSRDEFDGLWIANQINEALDGEK